MSYDNFRVPRVATALVLPAALVASHFYDVARTRETIHDGVAHRDIAMRSDLLTGEIREFAYKAITAPTEAKPYLAIWDSDHDIDVAHWPLLVPELRAQTLEVFGSSALVTSWSGTVAGSVFTGPAAGTNAGDAWTNLLNALAEEELVQASYSNWRCVNIAGVDYPISNVNSGSRTITVTGTPATGAQTLIVYPFRISGSTTTARTFKDAGRATMSADGILMVAGLRRRNHLQGHWQNVNTGSATGGSLGTLNGGSATGRECTVAGKNQQFSFTATDLVPDGVNGPPRVGPNTETDSSIVYRYIYGGQYIV
jgi:hypothetical protein